MRVISRRMVLRLTPYSRATSRSDSPAAMRATMAGDKDCGKARLPLAGKRS